MGREGRAGASGSPTRRPPFAWCRADPTTVPPLGSAYAKLNMKVAPRWDPEGPNLQHNYALLELETALGDATPAGAWRQEAVLLGQPRVPWRGRARGHRQGDRSAARQWRHHRGVRQRPTTCGNTKAGAGSRMSIPVATMRMAAHPWEGGSPVWINTGGEHQLVGLMLESNHVLRITKPLCDEVRGWIGSQICSASGTDPERRSTTRHEALARPDADPRRDTASRRSRDISAWQRCRHRSEFGSRSEASSHGGAERIDGELVTIEPEGGEYAGVSRGSRRLDREGADPLAGARFSRRDRARRQERRGVDQVHHAPRAVEPASADARMTSPSTSGACRGRSVASGTSPSTSVTRPT